MKENLLAYEMHS